MDWRETLKSLGLSDALSGMDWRKIPKSLGLNDALSGINQSSILKLLAVLWFIFSVALVIYVTKYK